MHAGICKGCMELFYDFTCGTINKENTSCSNTKINYKHDQIWLVNWYQFTWKDKLAPGPNQHWLDSGIKPSMSKTADKTQHLQTLEKGRRSTRDRNVWTQLNLDRSWAVCLKNFICLFGGLWLDQDVRTGWR